MQKKLLLSLVCTVPAALPALADVALTVPEVNNWNTTGISTEGVKVEGTTVTCEVGQGTVYQTVKDLPAGKYKITFGSLNNAAWAVEGAVVTVNEENKAEGTFELTTKSDITINITAVDPTAAFGFTDGMLVFVEDFSKKAAAFQAELDKAEAIVVLADPNASKALKDAQTAIQKQLVAVQEVINALAQADKTASEAISVVDLIKIYSALDEEDGFKADGFEAFFAKISEDIAAYTTDVAAWNDKAEAANEAYAIATTNARNLASLQNSIDWLLNNTTGSNDSSKGVNPLINAINADGVAKQVKEANLSGAETVKAAIEAFKAEVEAAFKDATELVDITGFTERKDELKQNLKETWAKFENDVVAFAIFKDIQEAYATLKPNNAYLTATADITNITDAKEYTGTDVYAGKKTQWLNSLQGIYTPVKEPATFEDVVAELGVEGYKSKINEAIAEMEQIVEEAKAWAKEQNEAYEAGYELYAAETTGWDAQIVDLKSRVCTQLPAELTEEYQALVAEVEKAVNAFKAILDKNYADQENGGLKGEGYDEAVAAVNKAFADADNFLNGDGGTGYGAVSGLIADLDKIKSENAKNLKAYELPDTKFDDSYNSIQAAIDAIVEGMNKDENHKADATQVDTARKALDDLVKASKDYFDAYKVAYENLTDARKNLTAFEKLINGKYCAETGATYAAGDVDEYKLLYAQLNGGKVGGTTYNGYEKDYDAAAAAVGQESYNLGIELGKAMEGFAKSITTAQAKWLVAATQANLDFAKKQSADLEAFMNSHTTLNTSVKFDDINKALDEVAVPAEGAEAAKFTAADNAVKKQMEAMKALGASVANYQAVEKVLAKIKTAADGATKANNETTVGETARKYYADLIAATADTKDIVKALETAFNGEDGITDAVKTAQLNAANAKLTTLTGLPQVIKTNEDKYSAQIAKSGDVRTAIQTIVDELKNADYQGVVEPWIKELEELLNVRLIANDVKVGEAYGKGQSAAVNDDVIKEYEDILKAADAVKAEFAAGYDAEIINANNALNGDMSDWGLVNQQLNDEYLAAVRLYTFYKYNLTEAAGYAEEMAKADLVKNYAEVYDFLPRIQKFNSDIQTLITKANEAKQYLPESEKYKAEYDALVKAHEDELAALQAMYESLKADGDKAATEYYDAKTAEYAAFVSDVKSTLAAAGFTADEAEAAVKSVTDLLADAQELFEGTKITKGETVNTIAEKYFSKIGTKEAIVAAAATGKWNAAYDLAVNGKPGKPATDSEPAVAAVPAVKELRSVLADNGGTKAQLDAFDKIVGEMADLNAEALADKNLIDNLGADIAKLSQFRAALEEMAQKAYDNAQYKDLWDKYMGEYSEMQELIDTLNEYIAEFNLKAPVEVDYNEDPEVLLENLKRMIGEEPNAAIADKDFAAAVETQKEAIVAAVDNKMAEANLAAVETLNTWIENAKGAFNTAIANGKTQAELQAEYDTIENLRAEAANLMADLKGGDQGFKGDFPAIVNGYLNTAVETYKKLIPDTAADELAVVKGELEDLKDEIAGRIEKSKEDLEQIVRNYFGLDDDAELDEDQTGLLEDLHREMDPKYDELLAALDAIQAEWEAEGDLLLVSSYKYTDRLNDEVGDKIADLDNEAPEVLSDIVKAGVNMAVFNKLSAEWEKLSQTLFEVKTYVENWGLDIAFGRELGHIEATLVALQDAIGIEAGRTALTASSTFESVFEAVYGESLNGKITYTDDEGEVVAVVPGPTLRERIETVGAVSAAMQTEYLMDEARNAYTEAHKTLAGKFYVNGADLIADYKALVKTWNGAVNGYIVEGEDGEQTYVPGCIGYLNSEFASYDNFELYLAWIETFNNVIEGSKALVESAQGQEYTPGDVVNRDGMVTSQDVMKIVDWVGNGVTYAELADSEETLWQAVAADINGDKNINIADIIADIDLALGKVVNTATDNKFKKPAAAANADANCTLAYLGNVDGNDRYAVVLNNETELVGGQFDIKLPVGMTLVGVSATERTRTHEIMTFGHDAYETRVVIFSMDNETIKGNNGAFVYIDVQGHGEFSLDEVLFSDSEYKLHGAGNPGTSGIIDAIIDGAGAAKEAIYDAAGRMYDRVQRGVNIIRHSDGSVTKELRK